MIIDNADILLANKKKLLEYISYDLNNQYIIFSRGGIPIPASPNHFCELVEENGVIRTKFLSDVLAWM